MSNPNQNPAPQDTDCDDLSISRIHEGYVLDHIKAGSSMKIYDFLKLGKLEGAAIAMIMNAKSSKMGKKDLIKIECPVGSIDLDVLGYIDHNITVNIIKDNEIKEKPKLRPPKVIKNIIRCTNPRCITSIEQELDHIFVLNDEAKEQYRCKYCEARYHGK